MEDEEMKRQNTLASTIVTLLPSATWRHVVSVTRCYSSFDLSSIYAVKYHLTTRIRLYQLSFLISMIPGPRYRLSRILGLIRYLDT